MNKFEIITFTDKLMTKSTKTNLQDFNFHLKFFLNNEPILKRTY